MTPKYKDLIDMGFEREEAEDSVSFKYTGYQGFFLIKEYPHLNLRIQTPCIAQNNGKGWSFSLGTIDRPEIIKELEPRDITYFDHELTKAENTVCKNRKEEKKYLKTLNRELFGTGE